MTDANTSKCTSGKRYRGYRESVGLTQRELAGLLGVKPKTIYNRESGRTKIRLGDWIAIRQVVIERGVRDDG